MCAHIIVAARDVQDKTEIYAPFNILPLDYARASQPVRLLCSLEASILVMNGTNDVESQHFVWSLYPFHWLCFHVYIKAIVSTFLA